MSTTTFNPGIAYAAYNWRLLAFSIGAFTAFSMSAYFICGYFVGSNQFWLWSGEQWITAIPGLGITFAMTAFQAILYTNRSESAKWMTVLSICVAAGFSVLSEIGHGMDRDNIRMESRSIQSPAYQALVGSLAGATSSGGYVPYSGDLQQAQARLATCQKKVAQGVYRDCAESQARVDAVRQMIELSQASMGNRALALANTAKSMERDENNYHPLVNLIRQQIGVAGIVASFILSLTIIIMFEYAFHYLGARYAESRDVLLGHGYDTTRRTRSAPRALNAANDAQHNQEVIRRINNARAFKMIFLSVKEKVLSGEVQPNIAAISNTVGEVVKDKKHLLGIGHISHEQQDALAKRILEALPTSPTPAKKQPVSVLGTHEEQLDMELKPADMKSSEKTSVCTQKDPDCTTPLHVHVGKSESSEKTSVYELSEQARVGAQIECPQCGTSFQKSNKWHTFCTPACRDNWHNERNPERMAAKAKRGRRAAA